MMVDVNIDSQFESAVNYLTIRFKSLSLTKEEQLRIYSLYKQATEGKCNTPKPWFFYFNERAKWNSWNSLGDMTQIEAKEQYVQTVKTLFPDWRPTKTGVMGPVFSRPEQVVEEESITICDHAVKGDLEKIKELLSEGIDINFQDEEGRTALHMACDRDHVEIAEYLLQHNANINIQDNEGNTPLHYACICGYEDIIKLLVKYNPNFEIKNNDEETPHDLCDESLQFLLKH